MARKTIHSYISTTAERQTRPYSNIYWVPEDGRRKRGRPKKTWRSTFKEDLEEMGVSWHEARRIASDRNRRRLKGFAKKRKIQKIRVYFGSGWVGPGLTQNFFVGKSSQNSPNQY